MSDFRSEAFDLLFTVERGVAPEMAIDTLVALHEKHSVPGRWIKEARELFIYAVPDRNAMGGYDAEDWIKRRDALLQEVSSEKT